VAVKDDGQSGLITPGAPEKVAPQPLRSNITAESTVSDRDDAVTGSDPSKMGVAIKRQVEYYFQRHMLRCHENQCAAKHVRWGSFKIIYRC
jgi:hypothetical protein